ncbi:MAG: regulatory protein RecX [Chloroflexota bacterium]
MRKAYSGSGKEKVRQERLPVTEAQAVRISDAGLEDDRFQTCLDAAERFIRYRPRSEFEVRQRLARQDFESDSIDVVVAELIKRGLLNDVAFAELWRDDRNAFRPRSRRLLGLELRQKGISGEIVDRVTDAMNDEDNSYQLASDRARVLSRCDIENFKHRLGEYLKRRGFDYGIVNRVVSRVWEESRSEPTAIGLAPPDVKKGGRNAGT